MANRYWVGGAGTWDSTNTTNWSTTSGGSGGASVPGVSDDVFIDGNSGGSVTKIGITSINSLNFTGYSFTFNSNAYISVYGDLTLSSTMTWSMTSKIYMSGTGTQTITSNGKSISSPVEKNGSGVLNLADAFTNTAALGFTITTGTFNTNNFAFTTPTLSSSNSNVRTINLGSSTVTLTGGSPVTFSTSTNLTFNAGTSTINCTAASGLTIDGGGKTFYNVSFTGSTLGTVAVVGASTFNNFSVTATTAGTRIVALYANQTINGSLTTSGATSANRIQFSSSVSGTQRTLSVATIGTLTNTNWKDIALTGAASPWTAPLGVFDLGNNSGITFDTTTLYWIGGAGTWSDGSEWSTSSGGASANVTPGPQNSVIFNASSGTGTVTCGSGYCNDFTASSSSALTFSGSNLVYGSSAIGGSGTFTAWTPTYSATSTGKTIASGGKTVGATTFNGVGGEWTLSDAMTLSSANNITVTAGSFLTNGFNLTAYEIVSSGAVTRSINFGSSTITLDSNNDFISFSGSNLTFNAGTSTIVSAGTSGDFVGGGYTFYNLTFNTIGTDGISVINGANTFNNFTVNPPLSAGYKSINLAADQVINGTFSCASSIANRRVKVQSNVGTTQRTITAAAVSLNYVDFYGIIGAGTASWTGTSIGDGTFNSGITFTTPKTVYWNLAAGGNWMTSTAWATTSGGTAAVANFPLPQDTANIVNTGLSASKIIYTGTTSVLLPNIDFSARTLAMTFDFNAASNVCGNVTYSSSVGFTSGSPQPLSFYGSTTMTFAGTQLLSSITVTSGANLTLAGTGVGNSNTSGLQNSGTVTLTADAYFSSGQLNLAGTTNLNTYTLYGKTCILGAASTTNFGTGKISLTGNNATIFTGNATQTVTGTPVVECTYSGATGTRTIASNTPTEGNTISFNITAGTDSVALSNSVKDLNFTGFAGTLTNTARTIYGSLTVSSGMALTAGTNATTFSATSGTKAITTNGKTLDFPITFNGVGGTWQLAANLTQGSTRATTLTNGTLDLNGQTYTCGSFATAAGTKNLTFNGGTLTVPAVTTTAFNNAQPTGFTTTAGTGTGKISMTGATAKTFVGGGSTYNCTLEQAGAGALTITGSNTFNDITNTTQPVSVLFTAGTTNTFNNFSLSGTSGNLVTIGSVTAASHTLSKSSGTVSVQYCSISRSTATGGALWQAYTINGNVNGGNNSGWDFGSSGNGLFFGSNF